MQKGPGDSFPSPGEGHEIRLTSGYIRGVFGIYRSRVNRLLPMLRVARAPKAQPTRSSLGSVLGYFRTMEAAS